MPEQIKGERPGLGEFISRNAAIAFAITLLLLSFGAYFGLRVYRDIALIKKHNSIENQINDIDNEIGASSLLLSKARGLEARLGTLRNDGGTGLLDQHIYFSKGLEFIEGITHPRVSFSSFSGNSGTGAVSLPAHAASYQTAAEQIVAIQGNKDIDSFSFGGLSVSPDGGVGFSLQLELDTKVFRKE